MIQHVEFEKQCVLYAQSNDRKIIFKLVNIEEIAPNEFQVFLKATNFTNVDHSKLSVEVCFKTLTV